MKKGMVFDIQRFSVHDGPGIRVNIFLKGCDLRCKWCHNPEGWRPESQLLYHGEACIGCKRCVAACPQGVHREKNGQHWIDFTRCTACGRCVAQCPAQALQLAGRLMSPEEVCEEAEKDRVFFGEKGGVTFSGGEPLLQADFLREVLSLLQTKRIHTAIETSGMAPWENFQKILGLVNLFLYDFKLFDSRKHQEYTGWGNEQIRSNLKCLRQAEVDIRIRIPVIKSVNDGQLESIAQELKKLEIGQVELFPYHKIGMSKYQQIGYPSPEIFEAPSREEMEGFRQIFREKGLEVL